MRINRRQFACGVAGFAALGTAPDSPRVAANGRMIEERVYASGSVLPPEEILQRHGIRCVSVKYQQKGTVYSITFASAEARVKAWDQFNADEDWRAMRDAGTVALQEIQVYPAGKIFEMSL